MSDSIIEQMQTVIDSQLKASKGDDVTKASRFVLGNLSDDELHKVSTFIRSFESSEASIIFDVRSDERARLRRRIEWALGLSPRLPEETPADGRI